MYELNIPMLPGECWYGFCVDDGQQFPLHAGSQYQRDIDPNPTNNQASPLLLSSAGRYVWSERGFALTAKDGLLSISSRKSGILLRESFGTLREAFLEAAAQHFPANGALPPKGFFVKPQYNTWIELIYDQNQEDVLQYARNIIKNGLPAGILMIDDGWADYYGRWEFNRSTFPNPKAMVDELHDMGFEVMLWVCPFISPDSVEMKNLHKQGLLVRTVDGEPAVRKWWNGYSAVLDFTNPEAENWFDAQLKNLMSCYGIDGFKFDAGDGIYYDENDITCAPIDCNGQTELWVKFGQRYQYNEYRACFGCGGLALVHRLADKNHSWDSNGVSALLPNQLAQGIIGLAFTCPDMIGGGEYSSFLANSDKLDEELFVRYAQCAALMPMMQFSAAPWRVLTAKNAELCKKAAALHCHYASYIWELAQQAAFTGEPIVRYMEYQFPHMGLEKVIDQFMLGDRVLVAPVYGKSICSRTVMLPPGRWKYVDGSIYEGGRAEVAAPLDVLPYFERME